MEEVLSKKKITPAQLDVSSASRKELEGLYKITSRDPPRKFTPNTPEHKADRCMQYKMRMGDDSKEFSTWSKMYNSNMEKALKAHKAEDEVMQSVGWGTREVTVKAGSYTRRMDIADLKLKKGIEVKSYETGKVYATEVIKGELHADKFLVINEFWEIEWIFKSCKPSGPLRTLLEEDFHWWVTCVPDKIDLLNELLSKEVNVSLDFTSESLIELGNFLIQSESIETLEKKTEVLSRHSHPAQSKTTAPSRSKAV
ncbi:MAG: hypothetical protein Crog4KO_27130 [Crocinitomicaceae bacterium]